MLQILSKIDALSKNLYYNIKPIVPRRFQIFIRRIITKYRKQKYQHIWPINPIAANAPAYFRGWPHGKRFALVLSHDVDTQKGHNFASRLVEIEKHLGFKSTFNIVPERYKVSQKVINYIKNQGFEVNVHGLKHDGKLFKNRQIFNERALKINGYLNQWSSKGFTAPSMICNMAWLHCLNIEYSTCTFDTDPFEPMPNPSCTIFPYVVRDSNTTHSFIELPYTLPQDHTLFVILQENNIDIWKKKLKWIVDHGGMALLNSHPDYMGFNKGVYKIEEYPVERYIEFLDHVKTVYNGQYWNALPSEIATFWKSQNIHR